MYNPSGAANDKIEELLSQLIALSLWRAGASQDKIARALKKSKGWVNELLKGVPKPKSTDI
jgi:hypothetical protein